MPKYLDPEKDPDPNKYKLAVKADKLKIYRGKGKNLKDCWYDKAKTWKHCYLPGCEATNSRFKSPFRAHASECHKKLKR